jgi:uncharacterized iron-regulated membrane protein
MISFLFAILTAALNLGLAVALAMLAIAVAVITGVIKLVLAWLARRAATPPTAHPPTASPSATQPPERRTRPRIP